MFTKWLPVIALGSLIGIAGCGSSPLNFDSGVGGSPSGGASAGGASSGGASSGGAASGGRSSGGSASGGATSGGASSGGSSSGGASSAGGAASGGSATGGGSPVGGGDGAGGAASGGNSGGPGDVRPSQGCNVADGPDKLTAGGASVNGALPTSVKLSINTRVARIEITSSIFRRTTIRRIPIVSSSPGTRRMDPQTGTQRANTPRLMVPTSTRRTTPSSACTASPGKRMIPLSL
jgi:hypothetical protein